MKSIRYNNKKGQAVLELGLFAAIILLILGVLLSNMQRLNDQQYVQMESFRRALAKAHTYETASAPDNRGAAVQMMLLQNRRHVDLSGNFRKGNEQSLSGSSSVFWAVPFQGEGGRPTESALVLRVNEDQHEIDNLPQEFKGVEDIDTKGSSSFTETTTKEEHPDGIINSNKSTLKDTITTTFVSKAKEGEEGKKIWEVTQGVYRDADGQYKYSESHVDTEVERGQTWKTGF